MDRRAFDGEETLMEKNRRWIATLALAFMLATLVGASAAFAGHRWGCWKYANYYIRFYNGATGDYYNIYQEETKTDGNAWDPYTDLVLPQVGSPGSSDHVNAYSGFYGGTGWLGLAAIIRRSGCTILQGNAYLNRSYLDGGYSRTNRKHVACQEIGHLWGLDHNRGSSTTCMNDTILTAPQPNSHDRDMVNSLY